MPINKAPPTMSKASRGSVNGRKEMDLEVNPFKEGRMSIVAITASTMAINDISTVSPVNCKNNCFRSAPITFRTPISFALLNDLAVARLMKLKQAISNTKMAMIVNTFTYVAFPLFALSYSKLADLR